MAAPGTLLLMPPPPPPRIQAGLPSVICRTLIEQAIQDGTHDILHNLMNIELRGALGSNMMHNMRDECTSGQIARARMRYAYNHFKNVHAANLPPGVPRVPLPWGESMVTRELICPGGCVRCFHYLCVKGIIRPEGFCPDRRSFLYHAAHRGARNEPVIQYIVEHLPDHFLFEIQDTLPALAPGLFGSYTLINHCTEFERPFRTLLARMQALEESNPQRFWYLIVRGRRQTAPWATQPLNWACIKMGFSEEVQIAIARFIDVPMAQLLTRWGEHPGAWDDFTINIFSEMLRTKNPHRADMFRWLDEHPFYAPGLGGAGHTQVNHPMFIPGCVDGYPPWGLAMWLGDVRAAVTLSRLKHIDPVQMGWPGPLHFGAPPPAPATLMYLPGRAAVEHFDERHLQLLTHWLRCASWELEQRDMVIEITVILENLLDHIESRRFALRTAAVPAGANAVTFRAGQRRKLEKETDIAIQMVRVILGIPFRYLEADDGSGSLRRTSILEDEDYQEWIVGVKANRRVKGYYKDCVAVLAALERPPDRMVLRRLTNQVMDWE